MSQDQPRRASVTGGLIAGAAAVVLLLGACGGGSDDPAAAPVTTSAPDVSVAPATTPTSSTTTTTTQPPLQLTSNAKLSTAGLGPVRIGMTVDEGERDSGVVLEPDEFGDNACRYHTPDRGPAGVTFMVSAGEIVRIDVSDAAITTLSGYGVGSTKQELLDAFGERIEVSPHQYTDGEYVTFVPVDELDLDKRVVWETDADGVVTLMRAGRIPYVEFVEGCA